MPNELIPSGWQVWRVDELGEVQLGRQRSPSTANGPNQTRYLRVANVHDGFIDYSDVLSMAFSAAERRVFGLVHGDVLLNEGQSLQLVGRSAIFLGQSDVFCYQNTIVRFRSGPQLSPVFARSMFSLWMRHGRFMRIAKQTTSVAHLGAGRFAALKMACPPLHEQLRIAEILDTVDKAIQDTEKLVSKLQRMKQGLVHDLLTWGVDAHGTLRDPERHPEHFKDSPTGRYPRDWQLRPLRDLAQVRSGIAKNTNRVLGRSKLVPYLSVANVQDGYLDLANVSQIRIGADEMERFALRYGDVLMNEGGDLDKLGRGAVWRAQIPGCVHQNHVFSVRCGPGMLPEFLDLWTGSSSARRYFMVEGKQTTNLASINKTALEGLPVARPPFDEQVAIVAVVNAADEQLAQESHALAKLRALKQGLMEDLLTGRVRVSAAGAGAP